VIERARQADAPCVLVIDGVEDPGNLGAVLRSAAAAGVHGILLGRDGTVGVTPVAIKASAGTAGKVPIAREGRLPARLEALAEAGFRVVALDPRGDRPWNRVDLTGPVAIVAGGEGRGLRPGILRKCTDRIAIPLAAGVESLNVSVATGVVLFEVVRQRSGGEKPGEPENSAR
jgi:23S rRNA (guanosine2251-2'-O)-methyltransferase